MKVDYFLPSTVKTSIFNFSWAPLFKTRLQKLSSVIRYWGFLLPGPIPPHPPPPTIHTHPSRLCINNWWQLHYRGLDGDKLPPTGFVDECSGEGISLELQTLHTRHTYLNTRALAGHFSTINAKPILPSSQVRRLLNTHIRQQCCFLFQYHYKGIMAKEVLIFAYLYKVKCITNILFLFVILWSLDSHSHHL